MVNYYAVKKGKIPGIYLTWKECEENVKGYSMAKYKKFESKEEAEEYMLKEEVYEERVLNDNYNYSVGISIMMSNEILVKNNINLKKYLKKLGL